MLGLALLAALAQETPFYVGHHDKFVNITMESEADLETIIGSTNKASGTVTVDFAKQTGSVDLRVPVASIRTGIDMRDEHLRSPDWLDAAKFADIAFKSKKVEPVKDKPGQVAVTGDFTMHGVTKEITVNVEWKELPSDLTQKAKFPEGRWLKFSAGFEVKLSDFGVKIPSAGVGKVSDTWTVKMAIFAGTAKPK